MRFAYCCDQVGYCCSWFLYFSAGRDISLPDLHIVAGKPDIVAGKLDIVAQYFLIVTPKLDIVAGNLDIVVVLEKFVV